MNVNIYSESESYARPDDQAKRYHSALITAVGDPGLSRLPQFVRAEDFDRMADERDTLLAQLAELQWHYEPYDDHYHRESGHYCPSCGGERGTGHKPGCDIKSALSASAEPSAPVERDERAEFDSWVMSNSMVNASHWDAWQASAALDRNNG